MSDANGSKGENEKKAQNGVKTELTQTLFKQKEEEFFHARYNNELFFYAAIKNGDEELVKKYMTPLNEAKNMGQLSDRPVNNMRYHFIISVALITRFCLEAGLPFETAYTLSDLYIQKADKCHNLEGILELHKRAVFDFTRRMQQIKPIKTSKTLSLAIEYIQKKLHTNFSEKDVAAYAKVSSPYLSTLFKKQTGQSLKEYINNKKIEEAKDLLRFSDQSFIDISNSLCFCSHSHFIAVFKKHTGLTPKEYRETYYGKKFDNQT